MLRPIIFACILSVGPAWAGCPKHEFTSIPKIIGLAYPIARMTLLDGGFQPLLDWSRMQRGYDMPAETWIADKRYFEVQACLDEGEGNCKANFVDKYRNLLRVTAKSDPTVGWKVTDALFVCGSEASNIFAP